MRLVFFCWDDFCRILHHLGVVLMSMGRFIIDDRPRLQIEDFQEVFGRQGASEFVSIVPIIWTGGSP